MRLAKRAGPRFPRPRSDAARHRGPGRQSDRSGNAAFLSPLRARPALRCPGQARIARPAAAGKRAQSVSPPYLRVIPACALPEQREGDGRRRQLFPPGSAVTSRSKRTRTETSSPASMAIRSTWERSARARRIARRTCAWVCRSPRLRPAAGTSTRRSIYWSGDWPGTVCWSTASGARETARTRSSSNRRLPIIGRERRSSAMPTFSSCRGSRTCDGAATRWCWNRRAPARCSGFAIRRLRPPWPCCPHRNKSNGSVGRTVFPGSSFSPCWWIAKSFSRSTLLATAAFDRPRVTTTSFFGTFTIFCSTRAAREGRHANPLGGVYPYAGVMPPLPAVRPRWPGKKIDLRKFSAAHSEAISPVAKLLRERHSTRSFDDQRPITLAELSRFLDSTARVLSRWKSRLDLGDDGPVVAYAVRPYPSAGGELRARALSGRRQMRRACTRILSLRRRRTRAGADRRPPA